MDTKQVFLFNYGDITTEHKEAASEIAGLIENAGQPMLAEMIKSKFKVKEIPKYDLDESEFCKLAKQGNINVVIQGFVQEGDDHNAKQYQLISICEDIRKLDDWMKNLKTKD